MKKGLIVFVSVMVLLIVVLVNSVFAGENKSNQNAGQPFQELWDAIDDLQSQIDDLLGGGIVNTNQLVHNMVVAPGEIITAGDVVEFIDGYVQAPLSPSISEQVFNPAPTYYISATALSSSQFVIAYRDNGNSNYGTAIIGNVSGNTITFGSEYVFNTDSTNYISATTLSSTKFAVTYCDIGNSYYGTTIIGDVSGNTISFGSEYVFNPADTGETVAVNLNSTQFAVVYSDDGNYGYGTAIIGDVSGNSITFGLEYVFNTDMSNRISAAALSSTKFVITYRESGTTGDGTVIISDVTGNIISFGSEYIFNAQSTFSIAVMALTPNLFITAYGDGGNSTYGTAIIGNVSGNTISFGSEYVFNTDTTTYNALAALSPTQFILSYVNNNITDYYSAVVIGTVSGSSIIFSSVYVINQDDTSFTSIPLLSSNQFIVAYCDRGNLYYGTAVVIDTNQVKGEGSFIGIAKESAIEGETVPIIIEGVSDVHSGLIAGEVYYFNRLLGVLTTTITDYKIGLALSETEILLSIQ